MSRVIPDKVRQAMFARAAGDDVRIRELARRGGVVSAHKRAQKRPRGPVRFDPSLPSDGKSRAAGDE